MKYSQEELLPVVAKLAARYTSNESTSISYDKAADGSRDLLHRRI